MEATAIRMGGDEFLLTAHGPDELDAEVIRAITATYGLPLCQCQGAIRELVQGP